MFQLIKYLRVIEHNLRMREWLHVSLNNCTGIYLYTYEYEYEILIGIYRPAILLYIRDYSIYIYKYIYFQERTNPYKNIRIYTHIHAFIWVILVESK